MHRILWLKASEKEREKKIQMGVKNKARQWSNAHLQTARTELNHRGYCVLEGFGDYTKDIESLMDDHLLPKPSSSSSITIRHHLRKSTEDLLAYFVGTFKKFLEENPVHVEEDKGLWNAIVNVGVGSRDAADRKKRIGRYAATRALLVNDTEQRSPISALKRCYLDIWVGLVFTSLGFVNTLESKTWLPRTGGRFLLTSEGCPRQAPHNDFNHLDERYDPTNENDSPGYFVIINGDDPFPLWVLPGSHKFLNSYSQRRRKLIGDALQMRKIIVPANSCFVGHGHLTHAGAGWEDRVTDETTIRYHTYLRPDNRELPDAVFFGLEGNIEFNEQEEFLGSDTERLQEKRRAGRQQDHLSDSESPARVPQSPPMQE